MHHFQSLLFWRISYMLVSNLCSSEIISILFFIAYVPLESTLTSHTPSLSPFVWYLCIFYKWRYLFLSYQTLGAWYKTTFLNIALTFCQEVLFEFCCYKKKKKQPVLVIVVDTRKGISGHRDDVRVDIEVEQSFDLSLPIELFNSCQHGIQVFNDDDDAYNVWFVEVASIIELSFISPSLLIFVFSLHPFVQTCF